MSRDMTLSEELNWRGFVNQTTLNDLTELDKKSAVFYHGFDASADSQTVGNLAAMMLDLVFVRHGWKAIILAGGATSLIGDPGGKDEERTLQDEATIARNVKKAEEQISTIFKGHHFTLVNNLDWTKSLTVIEFLRDIGKHFSMTPLVQRDYIAKRLGAGGSGISYTEFSYTLLQGMDYLHLYDAEKVTLQLGGSDQWGNCLSGVDLIRRTRGAEVHVITLPLIINKATGKKFGKSEDGAIWLDESKTSVYRFYQFWLNSDDEGVEGYLKIFTELDKPAIENIMDEFNKNRSARLAQKTLAHEVTRLVHGQERADRVKRQTEVLFSSAGYEKLTEKDFQDLTRELGQNEVSSETSIIDVLVGSSLAESKTAARRFVQEGAIYVNGRSWDKEKQYFEPTDFINQFAVLKRGKNTQVIIKQVKERP